MKKLLLLLFSIPSLCYSAPECSSYVNNTIINCGFENGDINGWIVKDTGIPYVPIRVFENGEIINNELSLIEDELYNVIATQGSKVVAHGFDSNSAPDTIEMYQDISLSPDTNFISYDFRAGWNLLDFGAIATADRTFDIEIQPVGGGSALLQARPLIAKAGTINHDTGPLNFKLDLSNIADNYSDIRVKFIWTVPENLTGPAFFQLDNIYTVSDSIFYSGFD